MIAGTEEHRAFMRPKFPVAFELFYAVFQGTADDVRRRLAVGDDPNSLSAQGSTPLSHALRFPRNLDKADLLFTAGARIDVSDNLGMHPIHWVTGSSYDWNLSCLTWLLDRRVDPNIAVRQSSEPPFHPIGWTPLHIAADRDFLAATQLLVSQQADANAAAADGSTPLHVAAARGRVYKRLIRTSLDAGAHTDAVNGVGRTPLHILAAGSGRYRKAAIKLFRHRGARIDIRDVEGLRPFDLVPDGSPATTTIRELLACPGD